MIKSVLELCYPRLCVACSAVLVSGEEMLCAECLRDLPLTYYWLREDNPLARSFWGRVPLSHASAYLFFRDESAYRKMFHKMKYGGMAEIGVYMGRLFGRAICRCEWASEPFTLVPVPLGASKQRQRGYNQAQKIAEGLALSTGWQLDGALLKRTSEKSSQTSKDRWSRWLNVKDVFKVYGRSVPQRVILVDDVITTGATLEACAQALLEVSPTTEVSVLGLAHVE